MSQEIPDGGRVIGRCLCTSRTGCRDGRRVSKAEIVILAVTGEGLSYREVERAHGVGVACS
jgi:hypothetical protein